MQCDVLIGLSYKCLHAQDHFKRIDHKFVFLFAAEDGWVTGHHEDNIAQVCGQAVTWKSRAEVRVVM